MKKKTLYLTAGLALVFAAFASLMIFSYLNSRPLQAGEEMMPVVVAVQDLTYGNSLKSEQMRIVKYPKSSLPKGYYSVKDSLLDQVTKVFMMENEPITASKLSTAGGGLSLRIADGMRAVSIKVDKVSGVSGFVLPGDRVDVIASIDRYGKTKDGIATTVLQNVEVLAAGEKTEKQGNKVIASQAVTLLVDASGALSLALSSHQARMSLALRNPNDTDSTMISGVTRKEVMEGKKKVIPRKRVYRKKSKKKPAPVKKTQELVNIATAITIFKGSIENEQTPSINIANAGKLPETNSKGSNKNEQTPTINIENAGTKSETKPK
jgi:pilus assembly protein CpaB